MMSNISQGEGWWKASDGRWYPPELHPEYVPSALGHEISQASGGAPVSIPSISPDPSRLENPASDFQATSVTPSSSRGWRQPKVLIGVGGLLMAVIAIGAVGLLLSSSHHSATPSSATRSPTKTAAAKPTKTVPTSSPTTSAPPNLTAWTSAVTALETVEQDIANEPFVGGGSPASALEYCQQLLADTNSLSALGPVPGVPASTDSAITQAIADFTRGASECVQGVSSPLDSPVNEAEQTDLNNAYNLLGTEVCQGLANDESALTRLNGPECADASGNSQGGTVTTTTTVPTAPQPTIPGASSVVPGTCGGNVNPYLPACEAPAGNTGNTGTG